MTPLLIIKCRERGGRGQSPGGQQHTGSEAKTGTGEEGRQQPQKESLEPGKHQRNQEEGKVEDTWAALPHDAESDLKECWQLGQIFDLGKRR